MSDNLQKPTPPPCIADYWRAYEKVVSQMLISDPEFSVLPDEVKRGILDAMQATFYCGAEAVISLIKSSGDHDITELFSALSDESAAYLMLRRTKASMEPL